MDFVTSGGDREPDEGRPVAVANERAGLVAEEQQHRRGYVDNLKVVLVAAVIAGHTSVAWTGIGTWVFEEPHLRDPLLSLVSLFIIGGMFAMAVFFCVAGMFTPRSLHRKGLRRFLIDRFVRLALPMLFFVLVFSPFIEYVDPDAAGWDQGFWKFALHIWWPPTPGPTWFLGVLLLLSVAYAVIRTVSPARSRGKPLRTWQLALPALAVGVLSYVVRVAVPLGEERWRLALGQSPGWVAGFALGALGAERGWFEAMERPIVRVARYAAWAALGAAAVTLVAATLAGAEFERFGGGGTWESLLTSMFEGVLVMAMPVWLLDLFRRRFDHQGGLARALSRSAFAAFLVHQAVLVGLVLASRQTGWVPEANFAAVTAVGVAASFALGWLVVRLPGVSRVL